MNKEIREWMEGNAIIRGGLYFFDAQKAICLIDKLTANSIPIEGVDAIFLETNATIPSSDFSIDIKNLPNNARRPAEVATYIKAFIIDRKLPNLFFEIIF